MNGKRIGFFDAGGNVTLAEAISMASRTHEIYNGGDGVIENAGNAWYDGAVNYALNNGIIKSGDFSNYNFPATREQLAYIFANILPDSEFIVLNNIGRIPDLNVVGQYDKSIYYLYRAGILTGNDKFGKDAVIYPGNNPNYRKYEFKYITNGYPGETKNLIDTDNIQVFGVFNTNYSLPYNLELVVPVSATVEIMKTKKIKKIKKI